MAITYNYQMPVAQGEAGTPGTVQIQSYSPASHINDGAIVVLSSGNIAPAAANAANNIVGIAQHDSNANWGGQSATASFNIQNVLGVSQVGTLLPPSPAQTLVAVIDPPVDVQMNLTATTGWVSGGTQQANVGTSIGLAIDGTTGFYVADPTASNLVAEIIGKVNGPFTMPGNDVGNLAVRVIVRFFPSVLAV